MIFEAVISLLTFPGVVLHEFAHKFFCDLFGVRVRKVCYFRFGNPAGYVIHDRSDRFIHSFMIDVGPFIINTIMALFSYSVARYYAQSLLHWFVFAWFGVTFAYHSFPSKDDAKSLFKETNRHIKKLNLLAIIGYPAVGLIYLANSLNAIWFDLFYAGFLFYLTII